MVKKTEIQSILKQRTTNCGEKMINFSTFLFPTTIVEKTVLTDVLNNF